MKSIMSLNLFLNSMAWSKFICMFLFGNTLIDLKSNRSDKRKFIYLWINLLMYRNFYGYNPNKEY